MENLSGLCFSCMGHLDENGDCPHCRNLQLPVQEAPLLPLGSLIYDRYYVGALIKTNGECSAYVAYDTHLERPCTLREFFPKSLAKRDFDGYTVVPDAGADEAFASCFDAFIRLWSKILRLKGLTALVSVYDVFKANSTVYVASAENEGTTLRNFLLANGAGYLPWETARIMFMPVLSTLGTLHTSGIIHKGIDPSSIIVTPENKLKLTDFGTVNVKTAYGMLESDVSDGYAPIEMYSSDREIGAWSDIYAFTAVLFRTLVGSTPISAPVRAQNDQMMIPAKFAEQLPPHVINALINAMQINGEDRTRNTEQLRSNLSASPRAIGASAAVLTEKTADLNAASLGKRAPQPPAEPIKRTPATPPVSRSLAPQRPRMEPLSPEVVQRAKIAEAEAQKRAKKIKLLKIAGIAIIILTLVGAGLVISEIIGSSKPGGSSPSGGQENPIVTSGTVRLPSFAGKQYNEIMNDAYYSVQLTLQAKPINNPTVPEGEVIDQSIPANTEVPVGTIVTLTVSAGVETLEIPDVYGRTYEEAYAILTAKGFKCERSAKYNDGTHVSNTVAETTPVAGKRITLDTIVFVSVWSEAEPPTEEPSSMYPMPSSESPSVFQPETPETSAPPQPVYEEPSAAPSYESPEAVEEP